MAYNAYLKIDGVDGESSSKGFEKQIEIYSFAFGASNPSTIGSATGGSGAGKVAISSFNVMKKTDSSSASLFMQCCSGKHYDKAKITLNKASGDKASTLAFLVYEFEQVYVDSVHWSGSAGGDEQPSESVSFSFGKCKVTYTPQDKTGKAGSPKSASWDVTTNTGE